MKKTTLKVIAGVSAAGALAISLGAVSDWYKNWDTSTWFGRGGSNNIVQPDIPNPPIDASAIDGAVMSDGVNNGIALLTAKLPRSAYSANGISENADTAYVLTATITPDEATDKRVRYTAAWANAESDWAQDKAVSDYLTIKQTDYALTATVECKQAFGEQIVITCTSMDNSAAYATCLVDYRVRILGNSFIGQWIAGAGDISCSFNTKNTDGLVTAYLYADSVMSFSVSTDKSVGSISDTYTCTATITPTSDIMRLLPNATAKTVLLDLTTSKVQTLNSAFIANLFGDNVYDTAAFYNACSGTMSSTALKVDIAYRGENSEYSYSYYFGIDYRSVKVRVGDVELDDTTIII